MKKLPKSWTTVTPFSKNLALFIFILFPILAFCFGRYVQRIIDQKSPSTICIPVAQVR